MVAMESDWLLVIPNSITYEHYDIRQINWPLCALGVFFIHKMTGNYFLNYRMGMMDYEDLMV